MTLRNSATRFKVASNLESPHERVALTARQFAVCLMEINIKASGTLQKWIDVRED